MKDYHINIFFSEEDGGYIADIPDLEACSDFGKSPAEALEQVEIAKAAWLEVALKRFLSFGRSVGSPEAEMLDRLSLLVEEYEEEHYPIGPPDPVEAVQFRKEQMGRQRP